MQIATDADMVMFDFDATWHRVAEDVLQRPLYVQLKTFRMAARYGLSPKEHQKVWAVFNQTGAWARCVYIPSAIESLSMMLDMGHQVHVVSSIPPEYAPLRRQQMDHLGLKKAALHIARKSYDTAKNSAIPTKRDILAQIRPLFFADDLWAHCLEAAQILVPYVAFVETTHDGNGNPVEGVHRHRDLAEAIRQFGAGLHPILHARNAPQEDTPC